MDGRRALARLLQMMLMGADAFLMVILSLSLILASLIIVILAPIFAYITPIQTVNIKGIKRKLSYMCTKTSLDYRPNWTLLAKTVKAHYSLDMNLAELMMQLSTITYNQDDQIVTELIHQYELECTEVVCGGKRTGAFVCFSVDNAVMFLVMRGREIFDSDGVSCSWMQPT